MQQLRERLWKLRKTAHLLPEDLADKMGVSKFTITEWESGQANPDILDIIKLSSIYGVTTDYILLGKEPDKHPPQVRPASATQQQ